MDYKRSITEEVQKLVKNEHPDIENISTKIIIKHNSGVKLPQNVMVFQKFAYLAATKLKPSTNQVLMLFWAMSEYENYVSMDVKTLSETLVIDERTVIRALNELEQYNIIIRTKHPSDKRRNDYFINPAASWKGNSNARAKKIKELATNIDPRQYKLFPDENYITTDKLKPNTDVKEE
jgi:predicted transcriptional regulator